VTGDGNAGECEYEFVGSMRVHCEVGGGADVDGQGDSGRCTDALLGLWLEVVRAALMKLEEVEGRVERVVRWGRGGRKRRRQETRAIGLQV
jgi:hypothetical protein